jgi:hypothetical protein
MLHLLVALPFKEQPRVNRKYNFVISPVHHLDRVLLCGLFLDLAGQVSDARVRHRPLDELGLHGTKHLEGVVRGNVSVQEAIRVRKTCCEKGRLSERL